MMEINGNLTIDEKNPNDNMTLMSFNKTHKES